MRNSPGEPPKPPPPPAPAGPPPPDGPEPPKMRDSPLYPNSRLRMELSVVLPMYGRDDAGQSATIAIHHPDDTTRATSAAASWRMRRHSFGLPATRYTRTNAG